MSEIQLHNSFSVFTKDGMQIALNGLMPAASGAFLSGKEFLRYLSFGDGTGEPQSGLVSFCGAEETELVSKNFDPDLGALFVKKRVSIAPREGVLREFGFSAEMTGGALFNRAELSENLDLSEGCVIEGTVFLTNDGPVRFVGGENPLVAALFSGTEDFLNATWRFCKTDARGGLLPISLEEGVLMTASVEGGMLSLSCQTGAGLASFGVITMNGTPVLALDEEDFLKTSNKVVIFSEKYFSALPHANVDHVLSVTDLTDSANDRGYRVFELAGFPVSAAFDPFPENLPRALSIDESADGRFFSYVFDGALVVFENGNGIERSFSEDSFFPYEKAEKIFLSNSGNCFLHFAGEDRLYAVRKGERGVVQKFAMEHAQLKNILDFWVLDAEGKLFVRMRTESGERLDCFLFSEENGKISLAHSFGDEGKGFVVAFNESDGAIAYVEQESGIGYVAFHTKDSVQTEFLWEAFLPYFKEGAKLTFSTSFLGVKNSNGNSLIARDKTVRSFSGDAVFFAKDLRAAFDNDDEKFLITDSLLGTVLEEAYGVFPQIGRIESVNFLKNGVLVSFASGANRYAFFRYGYAKTYVILDAATVLPANKMIAASVLPTDNLSDKSVTLTIASAAE